MTDIGDWRSRICESGHYIMIPVNPYQMGNLVDALAQVPDTGDWWYELQSIISAAMHVAGVETLHSNTGKTFSREQIERHHIRKIYTPLPTASQKDDPK